MSAVPTGIKALDARDPRRVGPYTVDGVLGGGGMGRVYLGRTAGGHRVAIKVVRPEYADDAEFRRRFHVEVSAAFRVRGPFTAQVYAADTEAEVPWMATEYVPGPTLQSAVERHGALPEESVRRLAAGLAEGLLAIHSADVVHRDLKPANVILTSGGPKLLDFGIARALDLTSHTRAEVFGTAAYMSPEQALATPVGPASDVFSLGSTIAYAATGRRIFGEGHPMAVAWRVSECRTDEEVVRAISPRLAAIINACLVREPEQRATPLEVIDLADATGVAHPDDDWLPERPEHADESADAPTMVVDYTPPMQTEAGDVDDDPTIEQLSGELWVWHRTVDEALLAGEPTAVPAALGRFMGLQPGIAREIHAGAFSVGISWSSGIGTMPMLGSIVRLLGAVGAQAGDDIRLRFNRETDVLVVQKATPPDAAETVVRG